MRRPCSASTALGVGWTGRNLILDEGLLPYTPFIDLYSNSGAALSLVKMLASAKKYKMENCTTMVRYGPEKGGDGKTSRENE